MPLLALVKSTQDRQIFLVPSLGTASTMAELLRSKVVGALLLQEPSVL